MHYIMCTEGIVPRIFTQVLDESEKSASRSGLFNSGKETTTAKGHKTQWVP